MCMMCKKDGPCCCKTHMAMNGVAALVIAGVIVAKEQRMLGLQNVSYPILIAIVLALVGIKKLVMSAMYKCDDGKKSKKGKK